MGETDEPWSDRLTGVERFPAPSGPERPAPRQRRVWPWVMIGIVLLVLTFLLTVGPIILYFLATASVD